ncbi:MAG TPA: hypothetical protein VGA10_08575 [Thermoanaerobaculia bacterium]
MGPALFVIGLVISLVGSVMVISRAFRESVLWGLGCIFVPFVYIIFVITHWEDSRKGFMTALAGTALFFLGALVTPSPQKHLPQPVQEQASMVPATTTHATFDSINAPPPQPLPPPVTQSEEPVQPVFAQVWVDNRTRLYYAKECTQHPENAYLLARSVAISQGFKVANCK